MHAARLVLAAILACVTGQAAAKPVSQEQRWQESAKRVTILRDTWGIPHVFGKTDADAVFGLLYAQAEDDFARVELNYINALGRLAEVEGEAQLWRDLRMKLFIDPAELKVQYAASPAWLRKLMDAFADGLNFYLRTHPEVKPKLITHFEPWMALAFSEGSIGGDIESVKLGELERFYGQRSDVAANDVQLEPTGSNGFAIAPRLSKSGHALLMINPHTSFYFRPEVHMVSGEGLNAYGAVTWGQFFVYQGFNERAGWMHTSGGADVIDEYLETVSQKDGKFYYQHGKRQRPLRVVQLTLPYKSASGMASKAVTAYFTHHGPVVRAQNGKWVSVSLMQAPRQALTQSYARTKTTSYKAFRKVMGLRTNSSNNTVYADADGNIAYFHGNFVPRRDGRFDWRNPVDGSDPATDWKGLHPIEQTIHLHNPASGWIQNTNNWPFSAAGTSSPRQQDYPDYMWALPENARGLNAVTVLGRQKEFTLDSLIAAAYDSRLAAFDILLPPLLKAFDEAPAGDPHKDALAQQIAMLRGWDRRCGVESSATTLAIYYAQELAARTPTGSLVRGSIAWLTQLAQRAPAEQLDILARAASKLQADFGNWQTPWGQVNRFQRTSGAIEQQYDDQQPSEPVGFASAYWGSLAAFGMVAPQTTKRIYGDRGNSFVAAVEFGPRLRAKSILAGGQSGDPQSRHFRDQAAMYSRGQFKDVLFYQDDIERHLERRYHPGE